MSSNLNTPSVQHNPLGPNGTVRCTLHGEQASRFVSHTPQNPDRPFYKCSRTDASKCGFFLWEDNPILHHHLAVPPAPAPSSSQGAPNALSTPQPNLLRSASSSTIQSTPVKRTHSQSLTNLESASTPSKRARLEAIQAGLQARREERPSPPPPAVDVLPFTDGVDASSPASDTSTDVGQELESPPTQYNTFLGLPPSQGSAGPRTPKKRPFSISDEKRELFGSLSALLTPPQTVKQRSNPTEAFFPTVNTSGSSRADPVTPTRHKGKQRATTSARWDELVNSQENDNPFIDTPLSSLKRKLEWSSARASVDAQSQSQGESLPATTGEQITADIRGMLENIQTLRASAERLAGRDPIRYIERLERQRSALEVADAAKKERIDELLEEVRRRDELIARLTEGRH